MSYGGDCVSTPSEMSNPGIDLLRDESELKWAAEGDVIDPLWGGVSRPELGLKSGVKMTVTPQQGVEEVGIRLRRESC